MRNILTFLAVCIATGVFGQKNEEKVIQQTFQNYKTAILAGHGEDAVQYLDSHSIKYYEDIIQHVRNSDSATVENLSILDKLIVFSIRHRAERKDILSFDGKSLLVYAIKSGMVGKNSVANNSVGDISVIGNTAKGQLIVNGTPTPMYFEFNKEQNIWKIDLTSLFEVSTAAFKTMADDSGESESNYIFMLLEMMTGKMPTAEIWRPVRN